MVWDVVDDEPVIQRNALDVDVAVSDLGEEAADPALRQPTGDGSRGALLLAAAPVTVASNADGESDALSRIDGATESAESMPGADEAPRLLSLEEAIELTFMQNPDLGAALAREEQVRWFLRESEAYKYPSVDLVTDFGPEYNRPAANTRDNEDVTPGRSLTIRASQLLYDGKVSVNEENRRRQVQTSTQLETRSLVDELAVSTVNAFVRVLQAQQSFAAAEEFVTEMQRIVARLQVLYDSGAASKLELDFAQSRLASAKGQSGNSRAQLNDAVAELEFLTGDLPVVEAKSPMNIAFLSIQPLDHYVELGLEQSTDILLAESAKKELRFKAKSQLGKFQPILSLNFRSGTFADEGGNIEPRNITELKLRAEMFLFDGGVRRSQLNRTKAEILELDWGFEQIELDVSRRIKQAYNQITANRITLDATNDEILFNTELQTLNAKNLELGEVSIIELIEVEERLFNAKVRAFGIRADMLANYYRLMIGVGTLPFTNANSYRDRDPFEIQKRGESLALP